MRVLHSEVYKGFEIFAINHRGYINGYVEIPKYNPFYGIDYSKEIRSMKKYSKKLLIGKKNPIQVLCFRGKVAPEYLIDCHGGLTWSGKGIKGIENKWVYGFDTSHSGDSPDISLMNDEEKESYTGAYRSIMERGVVRDLDYVKEELYRIVDQLISWSKILRKNQLLNQNK